MPKAPRTLPPAPRDGRGGDYTPSGLICARAITGFQRACSAAMKAANSALVLPTARAVSWASFSVTAALRVAHGNAIVAVTLSAGLSEHHAGEAVAQTLQRAERALQEAKTQGGAQAVAA